MAGTDAVLLDLDGVLVTAWQPVPGAVEALGWLRDRGLPFLVATNTTSLTRDELAKKLVGAGLEVAPRELLTAPVVTAAYLVKHHPGARCHLVGEPASLRDLEGVELVEERPDVVLVAGADATFTWESLSRAFRMLLDGAVLVAMHRNLSWLTEEGMQLDTGAFLLGLERAAGAEAVVTGKPSPDFFRQCLDLLGTDAGHTMMVGDDLEADVLAAQRLGLAGVLVRTGKFREEELERTEEKPDLVIDSVADLPVVVG